MIPPPLTGNKIVSRNLTIGETIVNMGEAPKNGKISMIRNIIP